AYVARTLSASWNGLGASGCWAAVNAVGAARLDKRAQTVVRTVGTRLWDREGKSLYHYDRGEGRRLPDLLGDLAAGLAAYLDAYETGLHPGALGGARRTALTMRERLEDAETGGFWDRPAGGEPGRLGTREKPIEENA